MSWLSRLVSRGRKVPVEQLASVLERILETARDLAEYRAALMVAAQKGDLDAPFESWKAANRRAQDYIRHG
jgi:hypothetical protein